MSWTVIRKATVEDYERLTRAAIRFRVRHGIPLRVGQVSTDAVEMATEELGDESSVEAIQIRYLARLWRGCVQRALRSRDADGIAWGYVGRSVEA